MRVRLGTVIHRSNSVLDGDNSPTRHKMIQIDPEVSPQEEQLANAMRALMAVVPKNEFGFPLYSYRPDLLPFYDYKPEGEWDELLRPQGAESEVNPIDLSIESMEVIHHGQEDAQSESESAEEREAQQGRELLDEDDPPILLADPVDHGEEALQPKSLPSPFRSPGVGESGQRQAVSSAVSDRIAGFKKSDLHAAHFALHYDEGFPSTETGSPVWEQFEFEPQSAYLCFMGYLQMARVSGGVRSLYDLPQLLISNEYLQLNADNSPTDYVPKLKMYFQIYNWGFRAKAYDLYRSAAHKKVLEFRAIETLDDQYSFASRLLKKTLGYIEEDEDFWDMMTPKVAVDLMEKLAKIQRLSAGLPSAAPPTEKQGGGNEGKDFEMIFRTLAQQANTGGKEVVDVKAGDGQLTSAILSDPKMTQLAQELIIRMSTNGKS